MFETCCDHGRANRLLVGIIEQIAPSARPHRSEDGVVVLVFRTRTRASGLRARMRRVASTPPPPASHEDDVGSHLGSPRDGGLSVGGLCDDAHSSGLVDDLREALPNTGWSSAISTPIASVTLLPAAGGR